MKLVYTVKKISKADLNCQTDDDECCAHDCYERPTLRCISSNYECVEGGEYCSRECLEHDAMA